MRVVVLGATGMLGSMVLRVLGDEQGLELCATVRARLANDLGSPGTHCDILELDALNCRPSEIESALKHADWAINCIGVIKAHIHDDDPQER